MPHLPRYKDQEPHHWGPSYSSVHCYVNNKVITLGKMKKLIELCISTQWSHLHMCPTMQLLLHRATAHIETLTSLP